MLPENGQIELICSVIEPAHLLAAVTVASTSFATPPPYFGDSLWQGVTCVRWVEETDGRKLYDIATPEMAAAHILSRQRYRLKMTDLAIMQGNSL